ncbi:MAG: MFS transporter [Desulfobacterales bacterium]|nr:MFS transporter [Desulfobacterales bacterium]
MGSVFDLPNIRRFMAFRILFNSRFYYPIFTILFLDFGLTVAQFSILNAVWAATIVLAEVPSGAFADVVGRKRLVVFAAAVMVVEVGLIAFMPKSNPGLVFSVFLVNRVLSGLAEAAASGADEALAYDTLKEEGLEDQWGLVLEKTMKYRSLGYVLATVVGAAVYDPSLMGQLASALGLSIVPDQDMTLRFPLYLTFVLALLALYATLGMSEGRAWKNRDPRDVPRLSQAFGKTLGAGVWILKTPFVLKVILFGMLADGVIRMAITLSSQYYRMIEIPESLFGILGAMVALMGMVIPKVARRVAEARTPDQNLWLTAGLAALGLYTMGLFWPWFGVVPALVAFGAMTFNSFFVSYYINRETDSHHRATVLSFKGLSYNVSYGLLGVVYALALKSRRAVLMGDGVETGLENQVFMDTFPWFGWCFMGGFVLLALVYGLVGRRR